jgi:peptidoglycan/LPS O-acetylase OafA/YrhL
MRPPPQDSAAPARTAPHERNLGLDLVRSIAILLVMFSHYCNNLLYWFGIKPDPRVFFAGDLGVELFFALSGFLIGRILLDLARQAPTPRNLLIFLIRRWMRTLPVYFIWLAVLLLLWPPAQGALGYALHFATMTQNFLQPMPPDYFYAVSWSLAIEEWFYLLFGCALMASAARWHGPAGIWGPLLAFLAVPLCLRLFVPQFYNWDNGLAKVVGFRLDEIAYGVVLAELFRRGSWVFRHPFAPLCLGVAVLGGIWSGQLVIRPIALAPALVYNYTIIGCVLCLPAALRLRRGPRWFVAVVRGLSSQSYALYIVHLTVIVDLAQGLWWRHAISSVQAAAIALILPFLLSYLSFRCIERPLLARRPVQTPGAGGGAPGMPRFAVSPVRTGR